MIKITIDTGNAAFQENGMRNELEKIFNRILGKVERSDIFGIMDSNGNIVGHYEIINDSE
jgi:hypothetical protein